MLTHEVVKRLEADDEVNRVAKIHGIPVSTIISIITSLWPVIQQILQTIGSKPVTPPAPPAGS